MPHSSPARRTGRAILMAPLFAVAVVWVLVDDLFRAVVVPAVNRLARLGLLRRIEALVARLPPYPTLALFLIPLAVIEPCKIYGLYLIGTGHPFLGILSFAAAKVIGVGLAERLFAVSRDKLLSIGWFRRAYDRLVAVKDRVHAYLRTTRWWPAFVSAIGRVRAGLGALRARVRRVLAGARARLSGADGSARRGAWARRFGLARRKVALYLHPQRRTEGATRSPPSRAGALPARAPAPHLSPAGSRDPSERPTC